VLLLLDEAVPALYFFIHLFFLLFFPAGAYCFFGRQWQSAIATRTGKDSKRQLQIIMPRRAATTTTTESTTTTATTTKTTKNYNNHRVMS